MEAATRQQQNQGNCPAVKQWAASTNLPASSHSNSMAPSFIFEPPREEEVELSEAEGREEEEKEASEDEGGGGDKPLNQRQKQSPWDFASYS
ncbi:hypothetical protein Peur_009756 [Populus x canadensis]